MLLAVNTIDSVARFITVLLIFIFVLFITFYSTKFIANFQKGKMSNSNIKIIEVAKLTPNKYIEIVKIGNEYFAIAIGKDNVSLISKLSGEDLIIKDDALDEMPNFKEIFEKVKNLKHTDTKDSLKESEVMDCEKDND